MIRCIAEDKNGIPRTWGEGHTSQEAETQCQLALLEYLDAKGTVCTGTPWLGKFSFRFEEREAAA